MGRSIEQNIELLNRRAYWQGHLERWQASGRKATAYCKEEGLSIDRFKYWQYRLLPNSKAYRGHKEFVEVCLTERTEHRIIETTKELSPILLETPSGYKLHLPRDLSQAELTVLLSSLRQSSC